MNIISNKDGDSGS